MNSARNKQAVACLAGQMKYKNISTAFDQICNSAPYSYLYLDFHPRTPIRLSLRTNVFEGDGTQVVLSYAE